MSQNKRMTRALGAAALALAIGFGAPKAQAAECGRNGEGFEAWLSSFEKEAAAAGISKAAIDSSLRDVYYDRSVISHDRGQKVFRQTFEQFSARMANSFRVSKGRALLQKHAALFKRIEQKYGVPGPVIVAIWGWRRISALISATFRRFARWRRSPMIAVAPTSSAPSCWTRCASWSAAISIPRKCAAPGRARSARRSSCRRPI